MRYIDPCIYVYTYSAQVCIVENLLPRSLLYYIQVSHETDPLRMRCWMRALLFSSTLKWRCMKFYIYIIIRLFFYTSLLTHVVPYLCFSPLHSFFFIVFNANTLTYISKTSYFCLNSFFMWLVVSFKCIMQ